jgi:hypothetical protein
MKRKLIDGGVKPEEIAFIQSYKSAEEKAMLFDQINQGKTRILIASTALAGEGANFQRLLKAAYSIEPGLNWKSSPSRQRRGRAERQGNLNQTIRLKQYVAPGGDAYIWQAIERKALTSDQILKYGENRERVVEDIGDFHPDYSLVKAAAAGNALAREQVAAQLEITRLRSLQNSHLKEQAEARQTIDEARAEIDFLEQIVGPDSIPAVEADSRIRIAELHQQISDAQETLTRIFPYEAELIEATQRLTSLEAQIAKENAGPLASIKQKASPAGLFKRLMGSK